MFKQPSPRASFWSDNAPKSLNWPARFDPCPAHRTVCRGGFPRSLSENDGRADWWAQGKAETGGVLKHQITTALLRNTWLAKWHLAIQGGLEHHQRCHEGAFDTFHCLSIPFWFTLCMCGPAHRAHRLCKQSKLFWQDVGRTHVSRGGS